MEKVIEIDGKEIKFRATAAIPRLYRIKFGRDIMKDMQDIQKAMEKSDKEPIPMKMLEVFENVAYLMAKHANPDMEARVGFCVLVKCVFYNLQKPRAVPKNLAVQKNFKVKFFFQVCPQYIRFCSIDGDFTYQAFLADTAGK